MGLICVIWRYEITFFCKSCSITLLHSPSITSIRKMCKQFSANFLNLGNFTANFSYLVMVYEIQKSPCFWMENGFSNLAPRLSSTHLDTTRPIGVQRRANMGGIEALLFACIRIHQRCIYIVLYMYIRTTANFWILDG